MKLLTKQDKDLIKEAKRIRKKFSTEKWNGEDISFVGAAARMKDGTIYSAPNICHTDIRPYYFCAEPITIGRAYTEGHRNIDTIVAYRRWKDKNEEKIILPCDRCRKFLKLFGDPWIIVDEKTKMHIDDLPPHA